MEKLPQVDISSAPLYRMMYASVGTQLLLAGIRLKVFNHLTEAKTAADMAAVLGSHPENTRTFLNGLVACELLRKKDGRYCNAPLADVFLTEGKPTYLGEGFAAQAAMKEAMLGDLPQRVMEGPPAASPEEDSGGEEKWGRFAVWMANNERAGVAQQMTALVSALPEFASFKKMLDLGGGPGIFGIAMVMAHPTLQGVVFDRGPVVAVAEGFIQSYGLEDRMEIMAGDYNQDPIGEGYDFIWASSTLNFAGENLPGVMAKIYDALNPGGVFVNLSEGLTDEGTRPAYFVLCTLPWAMTSPIKIFEQGIVADAMLGAGFRSVRSRTLQTGWGTMDLDIARK